jgi:hypothetical protein
MHQALGVASQVMLFLLHFASFFHESMADGAFFTVANDRPFKRLSIRILSNGRIMVGFWVCFGGMKSHLRANGRIMVGLWSATPPKSLCQSAFLHTNFT